MSRAEYKKEWRRKNNEDRRFNRPLNEYLKLKHSHIYNEYCTFFKTLDEENPTAKDLTRTTTFRKWKQHLKGKTSEDEQIENVYTEGDENDSTDEFDEPVIKLNTYFIKDPEAVQDESVTFTAAEQELILQETVQVEPDPLTEAVQELISPNTEGINIEFDQADNIIAEIINGLEQEEAIRELLNAEENNELLHPQHEDLDEGIGLNLEDEIGYEPFDFYQEIDFDF